MKDYLEDETCSEGADDLVMQTYSILHQFFLKFEHTKTSISYFLWIWLF